jgi:hypothetical protein
VESEYIFVSLSHRQFDPKKHDYERHKEYYSRMFEEHGLMYDSIPPFEKQKWFRCFKVVDKIKALEFVFKYSEFIEKPEI